MLAYIVVNTDIPIFIFGAFQNQYCIFFTKPIRYIGLLHSTRSKAWAWIEKKMYWPCILLATPAALNAKTTTANFIVEVLRHYFTMISAGLLFRANNFVWMFVRWFIYLSFLVCDWLISSWLGPKPKLCFCEWRTEISLRFMTQCEPSCFSELLKITVSNC